MFEDSMKNIDVCKRMGMHTVLIDKKMSGAAGREVVLLGDLPTPDDPPISAIAVLENMSTTEASLRGFVQTGLSPPSPLKLPKTTSFASTLYTASSVGSELCSLADERADSPDDAVPEPHEIDALIFDLDGALYPM